MDNGMYVALNLCYTDVGAICCYLRDAKETCTFQSSLHDLAVKHGGAQEDFRWIEQVLKNGLPDGEDDADLEADVRATYCFIGFILSSTFISCFCCPGCSR